MVVRHRSLAVIAASVVITACDAPTVPVETFAYDPRLPGGLIYHWPIGATISVFVDPAGAPPDADLRAAVLDAFAAWEGVVYYRDFQFRLVDDPADAQVIFHHRDAPFLVDVSACAYPGSGAGGITFFCPSEDGRELDVLPLLSGGPGRVKMDVRLDRTRVASAEQFRALVIHEMGHVVGIGAHSPDPNDLLYFNIGPSVPSERDARTLRWVLRQPADIQP